MVGQVLTGSEYGGITSPLPAWHGNPYHWDAQRGIQGGFQPGYFPWVMRGIHSGEWGEISSEAKDIPEDHLIYREDITARGERNVPGCFHPEDTGAEEWMR